MENIIKNRYEARKPSSFKKLLKCLAPHKKLIIFALFLGAIGAILRLGAPLMIQQISQRIVAGQSTKNWDFPGIYMYAGIAFAFFGGGFLFDYTQIYIITGVTTETSKELRKRMAEKINHLPLNYFDTRNIGDVLSYVTNDVDTIGQTLNLTLSSLIAATITLFGSIIILFTFSWMLGLIIIVMLPIILVILGIVGKRSQKSFEARQALTSETSSLAEESYTAHAIIKSFGASKRFKDKFSDTNFKLEKTNFKAETYAGLMIPITTFFGNLIFAVICLVGGYIASLVVSEHGGTSDEAHQVITMVVAAVSYGEQLIAPMSNIAQLLATFQQALAAASRVFSMLEETNEPDESSKTTTIQKVEGNVAFDHVRFGYTKDRVIIHDFSQVAKKGQKIAIVGPTGAGKTTMVNLLMRFYEVNGGKITIEGVDTTKMNRSYVRSLFGMVLQDTWLFEGTFMENLKFSRRDATDEEVYEACKATHCDEFIKQAGGYDKLLKEDSGLSSGQKQLLTIARAMVQNAPMLILDEATSSVDTRTELLIQDAMDKLMKGRTSFVIAHRLSTIKNADMIIVMKDGDVLECGNHNQLLKKKGLYADLYNSQFANKRN
ncbi:MAG: ABC transporter ATP-binding protein/permease [Bacilli bacterium]|nr:ABC transporter ATP-binding protein/permease [Bacilli bacterium]